MTTQSRFLPLLLATCFGLGALALIPAQQTAGVAVPEADVPAVSTSVGQPDPLLLRTLDEALRPSREHSPQEQEVTRVAAAQEEQASVAPEVTGSITPVVATFTTSSEEPPPFTADGQIYRSTVNLRQGPSNAASKLGTVGAGEPIKILEQAQGWVHIATADGRDGWVYGRYVTGSATESSPRAKVGTKAERHTTATENSSRAVVRGNAGTLTNRTARVASPLTAQTRPSDSAPPAFRLRPGQRVLILSVKSGWMLVATADGEQGWVRRAQ